MPQRPDRKCALATDRLLRGMSGRIRSPSYSCSVPNSRLVAPLFMGWAGLRKHGPPRENARARARIDLEDVNFAWWALASALAFVPCAVVAIAWDAALERVADWQSPSPLGTFLMLAPWACATWFLVRAVATAGSGKVALLDDIGVAGALILTGLYAMVIS